MRGFDCAQPPNRLTPLGGHTPSAVVAAQRAWGISPLPLIFIRGKGEGIDDKKIASITGTVKTVPPAAGDNLFALANSYSSTSIAGLSLKVYYTFYGIYAHENFGRSLRIGGLSLAALLLLLYLIRTQRDPALRHALWQRVTALMLSSVICLQSSACGTGNVPGSTPSDLGGLGSPGTATTAATPANTFISALYTGLPAGTVFYSHNHLGSGALVTDSAGNEVFRITYTEYGEIDLANSGKFNPATGAIEHHLDAALIAITAVKYSGQEYDPETGFYYYNARYYDPQLGIFTTPDTKFDKNAGSLAFNRHMYVGGNPIMYNDPSGHFIFVALAAMAIGALTAGTVEAAKNKWDFKNNWDKIGKAAGIGAVAGLVGAGVGSGVVAGVTAIAGTGAVATTVGSIAGGLIGGASGGFTSGALNAWDKGLKGSDFWNYVGLSTAAGAVGGLAFSGMQNYFGDSFWGLPTGGFMGAYAGGVGGGTVGLIGGTVVGAIRWAKSGNINDLWDSMGDGLLYGAMAGAIAGGIYYGAEIGVAGATDVYGKPASNFIDIGNCCASLGHEILGGTMGALVGAGLGLAAAGGMLALNDALRGPRRDRSSDFSDGSRQNQAFQMASLSVRLHNNQMNRGNFSGPQLTDLLRLSRG